jgi:DNA-binding GntR family transcriptional regulator
MKTKSTNNAGDIEPARPSPRQIAEWPASTRPSSRYSTLARSLMSDIEAGRYPVGGRIPTESELQQRFGVSRHTVRQALRELKDQGILAAHPGIGTVVRGKPGTPRLVQGVTSISELLQFVEATRMRVVSQRELITDEAAASVLNCSPGQQWTEVVVLRTIPDQPTPLSQVIVYIRPEHADVIRDIDTSTRPVFSMIESRHGDRIVEVRQEINAVALEPAAASLLQAAPGSPALQIIRHYLDAQDRIVMVSVGYYPRDRFSHTTRFRVHRDVSG